MFPTALTLGPYRFKVRLVAHPGRGDGENIGYTDLNALTIAVQKDLSLYQQALVLHHELGHAIWYVFGASTKVGEEEAAEEHIVNVMSTGYIMAEQENPALRAFFDATLRGGKR